MLRGVCHSLGSAYEQRMKLLPKGRGVVVTYTGGIKCNSFQRTCVAGGARACECPDGTSVLHGAARCQLVAGGSFWLPCECAPDLSRAGDYTRRVAAVAAAGALVGVAVAVWFVRWARRPVGTRRQRRRAEQEKLVS